MTKFLNSDGLSRLVALIKQALGGKQDTLVSGTNIKTVNSNSILGSGNLNLKANNILMSDDDPNGDWLEGDSVEEALDALSGTVAGKQATLVSGTNIKTINNTSLLGSGNITLGAEDVIYSGEENYNLQAGDDLNQSLDNLDTAIHNLDSIVGEEILTPTIVEHSYIVRDPVASRGNLATSNPWRVEVFKGLSEGENLLVTYSGTDINSSAQVAGWYTDGDNLINDNYSFISNLNGYAQGIVGKTYLITVPNSTIKALALSLYTTVQAEVKRIGRIQAEVHEIENPNEIESISTTESSVSGGNNTVTITETNGTTTTFNVKNGVDGVSLGEVGLVQTTGNATDKVMSQNAVTEYGRKVTTEDLAGTSDWSKSVLEDNGWVMGAYVTGDTTTANANLCSTHFIPINDISGHNVVFYFGHNVSGARIQFYLENKTYKDFYGTSPANKRTQLIAASLSSCRWIRMACGIDVISQCYIYDNSTDEYIWKGDEYIDRLIRDKNPVLDYGYFEDNIVKQTEGDSETGVMSQRAVTKQTVRFTEGDLTGTGDWIKARLQELGWAFDSRLNNVGEVVTQSGYAATGFIPIGNLSGHSITFGFMYNSYSDGNICFYNANKVFTSGHYYNTAANNSRDVTLSAAFSSDSYIRMTCNPLRISECYIYDNTEGEYIWRGDEYLEELYKNNLINYENFRDLLVAQEVGDSTTKTMSQKAINEYARKALVEDVGGFSDWVRGKMEEKGWQFKKYLNSNGTVGVSSSIQWTCVSPFIPCTTGTYTWQPRKPADLSGNPYFCFYGEDGTYKENMYTATVNGTATKTVTNDTITQFRFTCNMNDLPNVYVETGRGEPIFKGDDYLAEICKDCAVSYGSFKDTVDDVEELKTIGRRAFGTTSVFNANAGAILSRSEKQYNLSSKPWVDVVFYNVAVGAGGQQRFFGFCPTKTNNPEQARDYIGFTTNTWATNFIIRRDNVEVHKTTSAISSVTGGMVVGARFDFRRKTLLWMIRRTSGVLDSGTIDLSAYDLDLGKCFLYSGFGYCSYVADQYVGWNNLTNMSDFSAFFKAPLTVGKFKVIDEYTYPSDDIDGSVFRGFSKLMDDWSPTQDENGHWIANIDLSAFTNVKVTYQTFPSTHYLYNNWDLMIYVGKIKATNGSVEFKKTTYPTIKDVYDITDSTFLTDNEGVYTIQDGHTVEIRLRNQVNGRNQPLSFKGTCTLEMWDWEIHVAMNTNLTPSNYDGTKIFGGMNFLFDKPNKVTDVPLVVSSNYYAQGIMKYSSNKLYARVYDTSTNTYVDKQISNT